MTAYFSIIIVTSLFLILIPVNSYARVTPNDVYEQKQAIFQAQLSKISDPVKKEKVKKTDELLYQINQNVCQKFDQDLMKLSVILEEIKRKENVTETVVAFGQGDTPLDTAAYWLNYAAEAVAYQKIQDYTPQSFSENNLATSLTGNKKRLMSDLGVLRNKILRAKTEIKKALDYAN